MFDLNKQTTTTTTNGLMMNCLNCNIAGMLLLSSSVLTILFIYLFFLVDGLEKKSLLALISKSHRQAKSTFLFFVSLRQNA